jgi:hypothetical protein
MTEFRISRSWLPKKGTSELDVTLAAIKILIAGQNVTKFTESDGQLCDHLEIPAYFLAEWIAENWWPLLWEPRKNEEGTDDAEFLLRHSMLAAQHGFALPRVTFVSAGKAVRITARARDAALANVQFKNAAIATIARPDLEKELRTFVTAICHRLDQSNIKNTTLHEAWKAVLDVGPEEEQFCRFAGALGLDPNDVSDEMAELLDRLFKRLGERLLMDLCLASPAASFKAIAGTAEAALAGLDKAPPTHIQPLLKIPTPGDNFAVPAWHRGVEAAKQLRKRMNIEDLDPAGASRIFENVGLSTDQYGQLEDELRGLTGAVARDDADARVALLQPSPTQRRFAGARALFTAWTADKKETRYLTSAVTRDQQASRAFAAELTAPFAFLQSRAKKGKLSQDQVYDLGAELEIGPDVIAKQALNNGLQMTAS